MTVPGDDPKHPTIVNQVEPAHSHLPEGETQLQATNTVKVAIGAVIGVGLLLVAAAQFYSNAAQ